MNIQEYLLTGTLSLKVLWNLRKNQWKPLRDLQTRQLKRLKSIVRYAYDYVPYYHRLFNSVKFKPEDLKDFRDLKKIPVTTKTDVHRNHSDFIARGVDTSKCIEGFTSGSTGIPMKTYKNLEASSHEIAFMAYAFLECGMKLTDRFVSTELNRRKILPNQVSVRVHRDRNRKKTSPNQVSVYGVGGFVEYLRRIKPDVLYLRPSDIEDICSNDASGINPRLFFSQSQTVTQHHRSLVRSAFGLEINDTYGSAEFNRLAFECNEHMGLHIITDSVMMEFLDEEREPVAPGEIGETIVTGLYNYAMPLIRYNLGDDAVTTDERCSCGRRLPLIKKLMGKTSDTFIMPSGKKVRWQPFFWDYIHSKPFSISMYQFIQVKRNKIILRIVKGKEFNLKEIYELREKMEKGYLSRGEKVTVIVDIVREIPREESGKRKKIICLVT